MPPSRNGRLQNRCLFFCFLLVLIVSVALSFEAAIAAKPKSKKEKKSAEATVTATLTPGEQNLANIPLPIGHEAKGLVLPDFDLEGHLRGKFEAVSATRVDEVHVGFHTLKITTYTPENKPDLTIDLSEAMLNLKTRILSSKERTTIHRADFNIAGDSVEFDTNTRTGRLLGNVKMVITTQSQLINPNQ